MDEKQLRLTMILTLVLAALAGTYFLLDGTQEEDDPWLDEDATEPVWDVKPEGVVRLEMVGPEDRHFLAEKAVDAWSIVEPDPYPADKRKLEYLIDDLTRVKKGIPIPDADPSEFGLGDPPRVLSTLTWEDGTQASLALGDKALGDRLYALTPEGEVVAIGGSISFSLDREPSYYRDNRVFDFDRYQVDRVRIRSDEGVLDLHRDEGQWWLEGWTRANEEAVDELLMSLLDMRVDDWYDQLDGPMEDPAVEVFVEDEDGDTWTARFSRRTPNGVLIELPSGAAAFAKPEPLAFLGQGPRDVGDPKAFPVDRDHLTEVEVELGDAHWHLQRDGEQWLRDGQPEPRADAALDALEAARIAYRAEAPPAPNESWGLITLRSPDEPAREVVCGQRIDEHRVCQDQAGGSPYLVPADELDTVASVFSEPAPAP